MKLDSLLALPLITWCLLGAAACGSSADDPASDNPDPSHPEDAGELDAGAAGATGAAGSGSVTEDAGNPGATPCDCFTDQPSCGSALAAQASTEGCEIAELKGHTNDLLQCSTGSWMVAEVCDSSCMENASGPDACVKEPTLPVVSMEHVVVQAQVEPFRGEQPDLPGDASVKEVQKALDAEGFKATADGWFGNETAASYTGWQKKLGLSGIGANGIPGPMSLAELGKNRYDIKDQIQVGAQTTYQQRKVNERTRDMLARAAKMLNFTFQLSQGSYNAGGVAASAGTHDGGGVVDIGGSALTTTQRWQAVKALRTVGFAAWLRTPSQGFPYHIHAVAVGDTDMSVSARNQVADYYVGKNGLSSHAADDTPASYQVPFTWWEKFQRQ